MGPAQPRGLLISTKYLIGLPLKCLPAGPSIASQPSSSAPAPRDFVASPAAHPRLQPRLRSAAPRPRLREPLTQAMRACSARRQATRATRSCQMSSNGRAQASAPLPRRRPGRESRTTQTRVPRSQAARSIGNAPWPLRVCSHRALLRPRAPTTSKRLEASSMNQNMQDGARFLIYKH